MGNVVGGTVEGGDGRCHGNDWSMLGQVPCASLCRETKGESKRERRAVLPVAVGHGIVILFLLKELSDGQQLFQHVLQRETWDSNGLQSSWHVFGTMTLTDSKILFGLSITGWMHLPHTCCAPLSLLRVRRSSEWETQISCRAARSRDRSVLKCSVASGRSGTF